MIEQGNASDIPSRTLYFELWAATLSTLFYANCLIENNGNQILLLDKQAAKERVTEFKEV
jgi:hypothetical protein